MAQLVKNPPALRETWVQSLGREDPQKRERLSTPVFWPGKFHGLYSPCGHKESGTTEPLSLHFTLHPELLQQSQLSVFFSRPCDFFGFGLGGSEGLFLSAQFSFFLGNTQS